MPSNVDEVILVLDEDDETTMEDGDIEDLVNKQKISVVYVDNKIK